MIYEIVTVITTAEGVRETSITLEDKPRAMATFNKLASRLGSFILAIALYEQPTRHGLQHRIQTHSGDSGYDWQDYDARRSATYRPSTVGDREQEHRRSPMVRDKTRTRITRIRKRAGKG